jgi:hypothetical protein
MKKTKNKTARSMLDEKKSKHKLEVAFWRKVHPDKNKEIYKRYFLKQKGTAFKPKNSEAYYGAFNKNIQKVVSKTKRGGKRE